MSNIPRHIGIIMDGNGRWAQQRDKPRFRGHEQGIEQIRGILGFAARHTDIEAVTLYAFSTENWRRPKLEVDFLMKLFSRYLKNEVSFFVKHNVRFIAIGNLKQFSASLQKQIKAIEDKTAHCTALTQYMALNYGAHDEIVRAANALVEQGESITKESLQDALDIALPVDLLIRTGGDQRLSNFLLWQAAYAELVFTPTLWPDFTPEEFADILGRFQSVDRRFGGV